MMKTEKKRKYYLPLLVIAICAAVICNGTIAAPVTAVSGQFAVDNTPPTVPQLLEPVAAEMIIAPFARLEAETSDILSGVDSYAFELDGVTGEWQSVNWLVPENLHEGSHSWRCRARDRAGNVSAWSELWPFEYYYGDDTDADTLPDSWEVAHLGGLDFSDGNRDSDGDGFTDLEEAKAGTHPFSFQLSLRSGWNLLALPCNPSFEELAPFYEHILPHDWVWSWRDDHYQRIQVPAAYEGFWAYTPAETADVIVTGLPPDSNGVTLNSGWNLHGAGKAATILNLAALQAMWNWTDFGYQKVAAVEGTVLLEPLCGYWMYSNSGGLIEFVDYLEEGAEY